MSTDEKTTRIHKLFVDEATELLQEINSQLLAFEENVDNISALDEVLRAAHSVKGTAAATGVKNVETMVHNFESCAVVLRSDPTRRTPKAFDVLYRLLDAIESESLNLLSPRRGGPSQPVPTSTELESAFGRNVQLAEVPAAEQTSSEAETSSNRDRRDAQEPAAPVRTSGSVSATSEDGSSLRVGTAKIDRLMNCVEDLLQLKAGGGRRQHDLHTLEESTLRMDRQLVRLKTLLQESGNTELRNNPILSELRKEHEATTQLVNHLAHEIRQHTHRLDGLAERLQEDIRSVRMVPVGTALATTPRMIRDVSRKLGRSVDFEIVGEDTEVDRDLIEVIKDPILHLLRNALAHGGQSAEERRHQNKPENLQLKLVAMSRGGSLDLIVSDDGAGINLERVRVRAVSTGLLTETEAHSMSAEELTQLIFTPGFSTASSVDALSGRGFGLDIVRDRVESCGGNLAIESRLGEGTRFLIRLPLHLSSMKMLLLRVGQRHFAVPVGAVERVIRVGTQDVQQVDGGMACNALGRPVPIDRLASLLSLKKGLDDLERSPAVIVTSGVTHAAIMVDEIVGEQELIVKGLGDQLVRVLNISGATLLPSGEIVLLLSVPDLVRSLSAHRRQEHLFSTSSGKHRQKRRILIADDSITTRTLEKTILEAAGYHVEVATDGVDAMEKLGKGTFDLVLSDFQMPRMDGLELVKNIKTHDQYRKIPVVLVSSISRDEDKKRGLRAGADAYLGKQEFSQELLLQTLERLL